MKKQFLIVRATTELAHNHKEVSMKRHDLFRIGVLALILMIAIAGVASAGKRGSGKTSQGNKALGAALNQAAHAASRTKNTYLAAQYHRLAARRGKPKAIVAVMHSILVMAYHMIQRQEPYRELGGNYFDQRRPEVTAQRLVKRLEKLGFQVSLQQAPAIVAG